MAADKAELGDVMMNEGEYGILYLCLSRLTLELNEDDIKKTEKLKATEARQLIGTYFFYRLHRRYSHIKEISSTHRERSRPEGRGAVAVVAINLP